MRPLTFTVLAVSFAGALVAVPSAGLPKGAGGPLPSRGGDAGVRGDASGDARAREGGSGPISHIPPDPSPLEDKKQWQIDLRWDKGEVYLVAVRPLDLEAPRVTPRVMGRFAIELYEGKTLMERVRFDFPGLIDGDIVDAGHADPPRMDRHLTSRIGVLFPRISRGTRLELWDRATDRRWPLGWPLRTTGDGGL